MNNKRRKRIRNEVIHHLDMAINALEEIQSEEEEYADSMPEAFAEKKEAAEEAAYALDTAKDNIESEKNDIAELIGDDG